MIDLIIIQSTLSYMNILWGYDRSNNDIVDVMIITILHYIIYGDTLIYNHYIYIMGYNRSNNDMVDVMVI